MKSYYSRLPPMRVTTERCEWLNVKRFLRFLKYFGMLFLSLNFLSALVIVLANPGFAWSVILILLMTAIAVVVAARDVSYIKWF